jgi:CheY-like chemotaxis protein
MMPEMDGIEATAHIRAWEAELEAQGTVRFAVPIVALTANAVMGMREMFIEKGFSDFLAKPIDISKMDEIINRWIPKEKRKKIGNGEWGAVSGDRRSGDRRLGDRRSGNRDRGIENNELHSLFISGVDIQKGIAMTGGTLSAYKQVLSMFRTDAQLRLPMLDKVPSADALPAFVIQVHALKSALASLGAMEISAKAAGLEAAGRAGDMGFIQENMFGFTQGLAELVEGISAVMDEDTASDAPASDPVASTFVTSSLNDLAEALKSQSASDIDRLLDELNQKPLDAETREVVNRISDAVLMVEFDNALEIIGGLLNGIGEKQK